MASTGNLTLDRIEHHLHGVPDLVGFAPQHVSELVEHHHRACPCHTRRAVEDVCDIRCPRPEEDLGNGSAAVSAGPTPGRSNADGEIDAPDAQAAGFPENGESVATGPSAAAGWADTSSGGMLDIFA